ncbi:hypothetical protein LXL04_012084 [Taraxacum kok-saghyz]
MTDPYHREGRGMTQHYGQHQADNPWAYQAAKAATAATAGGSLLVLAVPAVITVFLLATGFLTSGGFGVAAATVLSWMYKYATGEHPTGADSLDEAAHKLGSKGREIRDRAEHAVGGGGHATGGGHYSRSDI